MKPGDVGVVHAIESVAYLIPWSEQILSDCLLAGFDCRVLELHCANPALIGYIICSYKGNTCHILNLCITPSYQGQGYGQTLLESVLHSLRGSVTEIILEVRPSNLAALALYKKLGFYQDGIKEDYYEDGNGVEDAILLRKTVR
jgi:ribosomal-protein-alanine N-acetyltransferase